MENKDIKATIIIPLHNEASIVANMLTTLFTVIGFGDYEVLVGLDACTDNTADIVKQFKWVRLFEYKNRRGKNAVVNELIKSSVSDIIFIHDADWNLKCDKTKLDEVIGVLKKDALIGGVVLDVDNFNIRYEGDNYKCSMAFRGEILSSRLLREYQFAHCTAMEDGMYFTHKENAHFPFMLNILKKRHIEPMLTTGDDIERWLALAAQRDVKILLLRHDSGIYLEINDNSKSFKTLFLRHTRSHLSNFNIYRHYGYKISLFKFYIPATFYLFVKLCRYKNIYNIASVTMWYACSVTAFILAKILSIGRISTKTLWKFRANRS